MVPEQWDGLDDLIEHTAAAVHDLFGLSGAGIMIIDSGSVLRSMAANDNAGRALEEAQERTGEGPCIEGFVYDRITCSEDVHADDRWPRLAEAMAGHAVRAVMGVPVRLAGSAVGVLNVYVEGQYTWTEQDRRALHRFSQVLARMLAAGVAIHRSDQLAQQLQYALDYRVVIERGIGYLMALEKIDAVTAFSRLRSVARDNRRKVGDVAADLLAGRPLP